MATSEVIPANSLPFADFCNLLEKLHKKKKQEQDRILANFINDFRIDVAKITSKKNSTFFPILRLLLPGKERERKAYNLKEAKLGSLLVKVLSLSKDSQDAKKLLNFVSVQNSGDGDFASIAYYRLKNRVGKDPGSATLTVGDINDLLDRIATAEVGKKGPSMDQAMSFAIKNLCAEQMKWFLRIILKDLKLGMSSNRILAAFHSEAVDLYESCGNLSKVCEDLDDGNTRPLELGIQLFFAVSPMLSERLDVTHVSKLPQDKTYHIELKFDGERFQMHMQNGVFEYFSRRGFTYSDNYGKTYDSGLLTPLLRDCFATSITSCVLDGEMMGWDKYNHCFGSKGMAFDIKKVTDRARYRPCYCVFDVLYYNGKALVGPADKGGMPLKERLKLLDTMFTEVPGVIQRSQRQTVQGSADILNALNKAIEDQEEGIVVKDTDSYYIANKRNAGWYKIKPEYTESTMNDLDLVIIGADEGENKKQGRAKSFHVACADSVIPGESPHRWVCVGRVATGLTFEERQRVCGALERRWVPARSTPPPHALLFNKQKPDFWIMPEHSIVLQVRATELIRSADYGTAYTLRFPRVVKVRDDKPHCDVMTLTEFNQLVADKSAVVKLNSKRINEDQMEEVPLKSRRKTTKVITVAEQFRAKTTGVVEVISKALEGRKLNIISEDEDCKKLELVKIIESHGGKHVENISGDTWCGVVGQLNFRVRNLIEAQSVDIITTAWLRSLPPAQAPCSLNPLDMLAVKKQTRMSLSKDFDRFGDSYKEFVDERVLRKCFRKMEIDEPEIYLTHEEMLSLDEELFGDNNPSSFLRPCFIHFNRNTNILLPLQARMYGATVCDIQTPSLTHVVTEKVDDDLKNAVRNVNASVVSAKWLQACLNEKILIPVTYFKI